MVQNSLKLHYGPECFIFFKIGPNPEFLNDARYSQNFLKLCYGPKFYNTSKKSSFHYAY